MYSLVIHDDNERLTIDGQTVTVPLFYATSTAIEFLSHLDRPWKSDPEDGADLCAIDWERPAFDLEEAQRALMSAEGLPASEAEVRSETVDGEQNRVLEEQEPIKEGERKPILDERQPIQAGILMGWKWRAVDGIEFTITFDYQGADRPYQMPPELARCRTAKPFFHSDAELVSLQTAVANWLVPRTGELRPRTYLKPIQQFEDTTVQIPDDPDVHRRLAAIQAEYGLAAVDREYPHLWLQTYMEGIFQHRTNSVGVEVMLTSDRHGRRQPGKRYISASFLALAWIEIMWAMEHDIYAQSCKTCGSVFRLTGPYSRPSYQCSPACRRQRRIERMGGPETLRTYNREHKRASRERQRRN